MDFSPKRVEDSQISKMYAFGSDAALRKAFESCFGRLRMGKVLEILDKTAADVAYLHTDGLARDLTVFTAACDKIDLLAFMSPNDDIKVLGRANYVGRTSMEVEVNLYQVHGEEETLVLESYFVLVATKDGRPVPIPGLITETPEEKQRAEQAKERKQAMLSEYKDSFENRHPNDEESAEMHFLFQKIEAKEIQGIEMSQTLREATNLMQPQDQNRRGKVFGGFVMRMVFELAWNIAYLTSESSILFVSMDHMTFDDPVDIGSVVKIEGQVVYTVESLMVVRMEVKVVEPIGHRQQLTNTAYFVFQALTLQDLPVRLPPVLPRTYKEGLLYLDGKRRCSNISFVPIPSKK